MLRKLGKENNFSKSTLSVSRILKGVKHLLECNSFLAGSFRRFPNNTVGSFTLKFMQFVAFKDVILDLGMLVI